MQEFTTLIPKYDLILIDNCAFTTGSELSKELYEANTPHQLLHLQPLLEQEIDYQTFLLEQIILQPNVKTILSKLQDFSHFISHLQRSYDHHYNPEKNLPPPKKNIFSQKNTSPLTLLESVLKNSHSIFQLTQTYNRKEVPITIPGKASLTDRQLLGAAYGNYIDNPQHLTAIVTRDMDIPLLALNYLRSTPIQHLLDNQIHIYFNVPQHFDHLNRIDLFNKLNK